MTAPRPAGPRGGPAGGGRAYLVAGAAAVAVGAWRELDADGRAAGAPA